MRSPRTSIGLLAAGLGIASVALTTPTIAAVATPTQCSSLNTPVYARINHITTSQLITPWSNEARTARTKYGFTTSRGKPYKVAVRPAHGLVAINRLYNPKTHDFRYVWKKSEKRSLLKKGYQAGSSGFYAATKAGTCVKPVYRYVRKGVTQYVSTAAQRASLSRKGWRYDKIAFYAAPNGSSPAAHQATAKPAPAKPAPARTAAPKTSTASTLGQPLYVSHTSKAWSAYSHAASGRTKQLLYQVAATPTAIWLGGGSGDRTFVNRIEQSASAQHRTAQFVLYAIPNRDCGGYAAGGLNSVSAYENWVDSVRAGIAKRPTIVIVEPDAIGMSCLSGRARTDRINMLRYAMRTLAQDPRTLVYIHAGSSLPVDTFAPVLKQVGVQYGRGIAVNVSSFATTSDETKYGRAMLSGLSKLGVKGKHVVIDTSRNGVGPIRSGSNGGAPDWCNPPGRALGKRPTTDTGSADVDAWLWIKPPGESDGQCHRGDPKGWFQSYALDITQRALDKKIVTSRKLPG